MPRPRLMNRDSRGSRPSVERRRRWLLVTIWTERLLFHDVEAIRERLEELPVLRGKAVGKLRNLHLAPQYLLDSGGVFAVALDAVVPHLRNEVRECFDCCRLLTKEGHD